MPVNEGDILNNINVGQSREQLLSNTPTDPIVLATKAFIEKAIESMQRILNEEGRNASGRLSASIDPTELVVEQDGLSISITAEDYADYIDKGVRGAGFPDNYPTSNPVVITETFPNQTGQPYQFKNLGVPSSMVDSMEKYLQQKGAQQPESFPTFRDFAKKAAMNVKARGIKPAQFISKTFTQETLDAFEQAIGMIVKESITLNFSKYGDNNT